MTTLLDALRAFREARKAADETYLSLIAAREAVDAARSEFELTNALAVERRIAMEYAEATERAKEARRAHSNLMYGLAANGGRA